MTRYLRKRIGENAGRCPKAWTAEQRLAHHTRRDPLSGCLIWQGPPNAKGYGQVRFHQRTSLAHRWAWAIRNGPIPKGMFLCHRCDERRCVNPDHLFLGDWRLNMADLKAKRLRRATAAAADSGRIHIFLRGQELVGDVTWETDHEHPDRTATVPGVHRRKDDGAHAALPARRPGTRRLQRRGPARAVGRPAS
jgi:hypothetical protein